MDVYGHFHGGIVAILEPEAFANVLLGLLYRPTLSQVPGGVSG